MNERAALALRISVNLESMKKSLGEAGSLIKTTTKEMERFSASLRGDQLQAAAAKAMAGVQALGGATKLTANEAQRYEQLLTKAIDKARVMGQQTSAEMLQMRDSLRQVADQGDKTNGIFSTMGARLTAAFGAGMLIDRGISAIFNFGREAFAAGGRIQDMSTKLGVSMEAVQRWTFAAEQTGSSMDDIGRSVVFLSDQLAGGGTSVVNALKIAKLNLDSLRAMKSEDAFNAIAEAIRKIPNAMTQIQVAGDLLGKTGVELLPGIKEGLVQIGDQATIMSDQTVKALDRAGDAWGRFYNGLVTVTGTALGALQSAFNSKKSTLATLWALTQGNYGQALQLGANITEAGQPGKPRTDISLNPLAAAPDKMLDKQREAIQQLASTLTSAALAEKMVQLSKAVALANQQGGIQIHLLPKLADEIKEFERAGLNLPDNLRNILSVELALNRALNFQVGLWKATGAAMTNLPPIPLNISAPGAGMPPGSGDAGVTLPSAPGAWHGVGRSVAFQLKSAALAFPQMLANAIINGQGLGQALRGFAVQLGGDIGANIGKGLDTLTANAGGLLGKLSGAFSGMMSAGVSIAIDLAIKGIKKLIDHFGGNVTRVAREGLASSLGFASLAALYEKLEGIGQSGLAAQGRSGIGRNDSAGNEAWMRRVEVALRAFTAALDSAETQLSSFGTKAPAALRPMIADLLKSTQLTDGLRAQLVAMSGENTWQELQETAEKYGIAIDGLGARFQQNRIGGMFDDIFTDFTNLTDGGADAGAVLTGMADEVQGLLNNAMRFGSSLPEFMRPMLTQMAQMGLLTDEAGNALVDLSRFNFTDSIESSFERMADVLEQIRDLLQFGIPGAAGQAGNALSKSLPGFLPVNGTNYGPRMPQGQGAHGVMGGGLSGAQITVISVLDGKEVGRSVTKYVAEEARFLQEA